MMTTSELAKQLGISRGTISRVINNHPNVKEETRQRVQEALKEYSYTPNETARSLVMKKKFRLAVIVFSEPAFFWKQVECGVTTAHNELKSQGVAVDYFVTNILNPTEQINLIKRLPNEGYDGIAIAPNNPNLLSEEIEKLSDRGFPIVIINSEIPSVNQLCYIGCDYTQSGALAAELFSKVLTDSCQIVILTLKDSVNAIEQRITGFRKELSRHDNMRLKQICRFSRNAEGVYEEVRNLLNTNSDIDGIYVSFGALEQTAQALLDSKYQKKPIIVGYDLNDSIYDYLKSGAITATICHEPFNQGYFAIKILHRYINRGIIPSSSLMYNKLEVIFASNAKYYINEHMHLEMFHE